MSSPESPPEFPEFPSREYHLLHLHPSRLAVRTVVSEANPAQPELAARPLLEAST